MVRKQAKKAREAANKAARRMVERARNVDLSKVDPRKLDLPQFDWERGRFVAKDQAKMVGHSFHAEDVAWPLRLVGWVVNRYIRLCEITTSALIAGDGPLVKLQVARRPVVLLLWHGRNFQAIPMGRIMLSPLTALTSRSRDGAVIANVIKPFGVAAIQGSGTGAAARKSPNPRKRGAQAFRAMLKHLRNGETVLATADVPPGPVFETGPGMVKLAARADAAIVVVGVSYSPELPIVGTWDKSRLPLPFGSRALVFGTPIYVPYNADDAAIGATCQKVTDALHQAQTDAEGLLGRKGSASV